MHTRAITLNLPTTGLALKGAFVDTSGTIDAALRDVAATEVGGGVYRFSSAMFPVDARGSIVFYTGTLGLAADFTGVIVRAGGAINPGDGELAEEHLKAIRTKTETITGTITIQSPIDPRAENRLTLIAGDSYEGVRILSWTITDYSGPDLTGATATLRIAEREAYKRSPDDAPAVLESTGTVTVLGTTVTFEAPATATQTANLATPVSNLLVNHVYQLLATTTAGKVVTLLIAEASVVKRVEPLV